MTTQHNDIWKTFIGSAISGAAAKTILAPLDRLKLLAQLERLSPLPNKLGTATATNTATNVSMNNSKYMTFIKGISVQELWKGNLLQMLRSSISSSVQFTSFSIVKKSLKDTVSPSWIVPASSFCSSSIAILLSYPVDQWRTRWMADLAGSSKKQSAASCPQAGQAAHRAVSCGTQESKTKLMFQTLKDTCQQKQLFRGFGMAYVSAVSFNTCHFTFQSLYSGLLNTPTDASAKKSVWLEAAAGSMAAVSCACLMYPLDTVRRQIQVNTDLARPTITNTVRSMYQQEKIWRFYKGFLPNVVKNSINYGIRWFGVSYATSSVTK